jgi:RNA polymerase sigma-70 factor (ECF subfamily)
MDSTSSDFLQVLQGLRLGEQQAAQEIYLRYINQLVTIATQRTERRYRHKIDPECVAHSALKSFLIGCRDGKYDLENWGMVYGLLANITFKKTLRRVRAEEAQKRHDSGVVSFEDWMKAGQSIEPSVALELQDLMEQVFERSGLDPEDRQMVERMLDGYSSSEVADEFGVTRKTVQRKVDKFRKGVAFVQERESRS